MDNRRVKLVAYLIFTSKASQNLKVSAGSNVFVIIGAPLNEIIGTSLCIQQAKLSLKATQSKEAFLEAHHSGVLLNSFSNLNAFGMKEPFHLESMRTWEL